MDAIVRCGRCLAGGRGCLAKNHALSLTVTHLDICYKRIMLYHLHNCKHMFVQGCKIIRLCKY